VFHDRWFSVWCFVDHFLSFLGFSSDNYNVCFFAFHASDYSFSVFQLSLQHINVYYYPPIPHRNTFASCLIRHTKGPRKGVRTHQGTREMCWIVQDVTILRFYSSSQKYFGTINFCRMSQDVGKLRCRIAQVPLYIFHR
jgi:hypothetical protein